MTTMTTNESAATVDAPEVLTTADLANARGVSTTAVRQGARRNPLGAPAPDTMALGRGRPWTWSPDRRDVQIYLTPPEELAKVAVRIRDREGPIAEIPASKAEEGYVLVGGDLVTSDGQTVARGFEKLTEEKARAIRDAADRIPNFMVRKPSTSAAARAVGVDRATFLRVLRGEEWSQYGTALKVMKAGGRG